MNYKIALVLSLCLVANAHGASFFEYLFSPQLRKTTSGEFLNGFFEAAFQIKTDFSKCKGEWRDSYTDEHLHMAIDLLQDHKDLDKETQGIRLLSHLVLELTYDFPGCRSEQKKVATALNQLRDLQNRNDLRELVEEVHKKEVPLEDDLTLKVRQQKWKESGRDTGYIHNILKDATRSE